MCGSVASCMPGASLLSGCRVCRAGAASQRASSEHPRWEAVGVGGSSSLPMLSPDVISPPQGGSTAKGRALLVSTAPGSLAGALVIWAVASGGVCPGSPGAGGTGGLSELVLSGFCQGKGREMERGMDGGVLGWQPTIRLLAALGRGQRAAVKPNVRWASPAEQVELGWGHLC